MRYYFKKKTEINNIINNIINPDIILIGLDDNNNDNYISDRIHFINIDNNYNKVIAKTYIKKDELLIIEYPIINLFGESNDNRELKIVKKYIETMHGRIAFKSSKAGTCFEVNIPQKHTHEKNTNY